MNVEVKPLVVGLARKRFMAARHGFRLVGLAVAVALALFSGSPRAQAPSTTFHGIGDIAGGGVGSIVRDATKVGGVIYAVGASTKWDPTVPSGGTVPRLDAAVQWSSTGGIAEIPDLQSPSADPLSANATGHAITADAAFIAARLRNSTATPGTSNGVKRDRVLSSNRTTGGFAALAISDNANIVYTQNSGGTATVNNSRAYRVDVSGPTNNTTPVPLLGSYLDNFPAYRGMSSNGNVLVGTAFTGGFTGSQNQFNGTNGIAFRWDYPAATVTEVPRPSSGSTWSIAISVSPNGRTTLAAGNSAAYPNGEVWVHDVLSGAITFLGSPNAGWVPRVYGGMTADGAVVGVTFTSPTTGRDQNPVPANNRYAYIRNSHGWFHLSSALAKQGIDLLAQGWDPTNMQITGIRSVDTSGDLVPDVDLVFGQGRRRTINASVTPNVYADGAAEGFVAEFPAGDLASFEAPATSPADKSIVGAWATGLDASGIPERTLVFMNDGTYYQINTTGYERGVYAWDLNGGAFRMWTKQDTNAGAGLSSFNGRRDLTLTVSGNSLQLTGTHCSACASIAIGTRIAGGAGTIAGGWVLGNPAADGDSLVVVLHDSGTTRKFFIADDSEHLTEVGTWDWDAGTHLLTTVNAFRNGQASVYTDIVQVELTADELGLQALVDPGPPRVEIVLRRVVDPSTVTPAITNTTLEAAGAEDTPFSFTVTAVNALSFAATGLPTGLTIDANTGVISGTPAVNGTFNVQVTVTNTFGDTHVVTFALTFAAPPASFHGIGDLAGGAVGSAVRDATRVNGTLYAVGSSVARNQTNLCNNFTANNPVVGCLVFPNLESPAWWQLTGTGPGTLAALPEPATHTTSPPTNQMFAYAISKDAVYAAGQTHFTANVTNIQGIRYTNTSGTLSYFNQPLSGAVFAMSDDGATLYGGSASIARRIDVVGTGAPGTTATIADLPLPAGTIQSQAIARGTSSTGAYMVGVAWNAPVGTALGPSNGVAFRYTKATNSTAVIPTLTGGTWNYPVAISSTGTQTVVAGNSAAFPNGEVYLTNASNVVTAMLGSPNSALVPKALGGITADGTIAVTFGTGGNNPTVLQSGGRYAYVRNSHGWFHLSSILAAEGVDLVVAGWDPTNLAITGVRTVENMDLVFGQGRRRVPGATGYVSGAQEGFVVELPAGTLAAFNPQPTPPTDQSIVGTWLIGTDPANPTSVVSFIADGTFIRINLNLSAGAPNGVERGLYTWAGNAAGGAFVTTTLYDSDGTSGGSARNGQLGSTIVVAGDTVTFADTNLPGVAFATLTRVAVSPSSIVGGWVGPYPRTADNFAMVVFTGAGGGNKYYTGTHGPLWGGDGVETGTFTWDSVTHALIVTPTGGVADAPDTVTLSRDELGLHVLDDNGVDEFDLVRIVAPSLVPPPAFVGSLAPVAGTTGFEFSFTVEATGTLVVTATGLPPGLAIDPATGEIWGTPTDVGAFEVELTASNTFGHSTDATLTVDVSAPAIVVVPPGDDVTVEPEVPDRTPEVTLTFDNVSSGGETTVAVIDPETTPELAPEPPGNFEIVLTDDGVPLYYDIQTTAEITGPTTICFSYAGVDFGGQTPRLFHYVGGEWVDITTSVDAVNQILCGETTSFSPFAIFKSTAPFVSATGFYAPVSPLDGFVNTAKAGSTVPLKFNVTINGVEETDTANLFFGTRTVADAECSASPQDQVDFVTSGETNLRYDAQAKQFIQNWKLPKTAGCVIARITYKDNQQEVVLLTAKFSVK